MAFLSLFLMVSFCLSLSPCYGKDVKPAVSCHCVPSNLCGDDDASVNGQGLLDIRIQNVKVCQNFYEICCENPIFEIISTNDYATYAGCGIPDPTGLVQRITSNSEITKFAELPWIVVVLVRDLKKTERNMYRCGGSLIHPQVVLTAAHCVFEVNFAHLTIRVGEWNTKSQEEPLPHQDRSVEEILVHPKYDNGSLRNDIALVFLSESVTLASNVAVICLPPPQFQLDDAMCTVGGWGKDTLNQGKHSTVLRKIDIPLVPKGKCATSLRNTRLGSFYKLHKSFICAGGETNKDTCKGDGGSPLVCPIPEVKNRFFQIGIVSWGIGCGENDVPGVYVNVALFSKWIDDEMELRGFDTSFYKY